MGQLKILIAITLAFILLSCISTPLIKKDELFITRHGKYMGTKNGYHHFLVQEIETVFYRQVKISSNKYNIDNEMSYTLSKKKWRNIDFPIQIKGVDHLR